MHIVFPVIAFNTSGGLRVTVQYLNGLSRRGHRVTVVVPADAGESYYPLDSAIEFIRVKQDRVKSQWQYPILVWSLSRAIPACDILMANGWQTMYADWFARGKSRKGILFLVHDDRVLSDGPFNYNSQLMRWRSSIGARLAYKMPALRVAVSQWTSNRMWERHGCPCVVSPNGVDASFFPSIPDSSSDPGAAKQILVLGQRAPWKGFEDALEAIRIARRTYQDIGLTVVNRDNIPVPSDIPHTYISPRNDEDLRSCYCAANVFLFSSRFEGFGLPPLEAMACGTPVVTTDCGGVREYAIDQSNCLMVPIKRPDELANAILRLGRDSSLRKHLREAGIKTANEFSLVSAVERFCKIVEAM